MFAAISAHEAARQQYARDAHLQAKDKLYPPLNAQLARAHEELTWLTPTEPWKLTLLDAPDPKRDDLMAVIDQINGRFGHDSIRHGAVGTDQPWWMKQRARSPRYTKRWNEIAHVR
jgi:hypothetical protein